MIIDVHAHLWDGQAEQDKANIRKVCSQFNVSKVMVSSLAGFFPDDAEIDHLNGLTREFMKEEPGVIEGYCYLNPHQKNSVDKLKRCIEDYGMCGVKLWVASFCDDPLVNPIVEQCIEYKIPILIHAFYKAVGQLQYENRGQNVANLAKRYPEAKIIMAHLGANVLRELRPVKDLKNVWTDFSGTICRCDDLLYAKNMVGADRLLFGSDMPGGISFLVSYGQILEADFTEEERSKVLGLNAVKLFERS